MTLTSRAFQQGGTIPMKYTCDGDNISPPFAWSGVPEGTRSFVLLCDDPSAPSGIFHHWAAYDIPWDWRRLAEGHGPESLADYLGEFRDILASHRLEDMVCVRRVVFDMDSNWKCFVENYSDGYHIPHVHRDSLSRWKSVSTRVTPSNENYTASFSAHEGSQLLLPFPDYVGFPAMPEIDEKWKTGTFFTTLRPGMMMTLGNDGALVFRSEPLSATQSRLTVSSLFPKSTVARNDFEEIVQNYYRRNAIVVGEDVAVSLRQHAGIESPYARMALLCRTERSLNQIANWILDRVIGPQA